MLRRVASSIPHRPLLRPRFTPTPPSLPASTTSSTTASLPMLAAEDDRFGGKLVAMESIAAHDSVASFAESLATSLDAWREEGKKGIWLNIPKERTELMPAAIEAGFDLHHTEPDRIVLNSWLGGGTNMLPGCELPAHQNPPRTPCVSPLMLLLAPTTDTTHTMGIGAVVINEQRQVLAVQEATGPASEIGGANNFWKYPTGCVCLPLLLPLVAVLTWTGGRMVEAGEGAAEAAVREVWEETGVDAEVVSFVAMREAHGAPQPDPRHRPLREIFCASLCSI